MIRTVNKMELSFPSHSVNESFARGAVSAFILALDPLVTEMNDLKTAVSEAVTNAIVHGYRGTSGDVYISVKLFDDGTVRIEVRDRGVGIADIEEARKPLFTTDKSGERSGMGFAVMEAFTDKLRVFSTVGRGTRVVLEKRLKKTEDG